MPTAIVVGATGILGREILFELAGDPSRWSTVYAISRSQKEDYPPHVKHQHLDLQGEASAMAKELDGVSAEYLFFAAYLHHDSLEELEKINGPMLGNFMNALRISGAEKRLKRVILVTGTKRYGCHIGRPKEPMEETDPWVEGPGFPPNFYYAQHRILQEMSAEAQWDYVATYPHDVIGAVANNFMNFSTPVALYAAVTKELGQELVWPGSVALYAASTTFSSAKLHARFCSWVAERESAANQGFNVTDGDVTSWQSLWPRVAERYGLKIAPDQLSRPLPYEGHDSPGPELPPIARVAGELGLEGTSLVKQGRIEGRICLAKWSQLPEVREAWEALASRQGIDKAIWDRATWSILDFVLGRGWDMLVSQSKARKHGWTGYVDSWDAMEATWQEMEEWKQLPKPQK